MFDELQPPVPPPLPLKQKEPEDMFSGSDPEPSSSAPVFAPPEALFAPSQQSAAPTPSPQPLSVLHPSEAPQERRGTAPSSFSSKRSSRALVSHLKPVVFVVVGVLIIGIGGTLAYGFLTRPTKETLKSDVVPVTTPAPIPSPTPNPAPTTSQTQPVVVPTPAPIIETDTDKDGLSDTREGQIGTNPTKGDTDGDGLFDREEVDVYHTNPLNPDTDGDRYLDGVEVKGGFNPNGPGKAVTVPQS